MDDEYPPEALLGHDGGEAPFAGKARRTLMRRISAGGFFVLLAPVAIHFARLKAGHWSGTSLSQTQQSLQSQIGKTEDDLNTSIGKVGKPEPPERPKLQFSLWRDDLGPDEFPLKSTSVQPDKDGNLPVSFIVKNDSGVQAEGGEIWAYICDVCSFAKEPTAFDKPDGLTNHARHRSIPAMNPGVSIRENNTISIKVNQAGVAFTQIIFKSTCKTCGPPETSKQFMIHVEPSLSQPSQ